MINLDKIEKQKRGAVIITFLINCGWLFGQLSPANDPTWIMLPDSCNEFNGPIHVQNQPSPSNYFWEGQGSGQNGQPFSNYTNITTIADPNSNTNRYIKLFITGDTTDYGPPAPNPLPVNPHSPPNLYNDPNQWWYETWFNPQQLNWRTAGFYTNPHYITTAQPAINPYRYHFGYFEIYARLPGYPSSGIYSAHNTTDIYGYTKGGLGALWWFAGEGMDGQRCPTNGNCIREEVDVLESNGWDNGAVGPNVLNTHWQVPFCTDSNKCDHVSGGGYGIDYRAKNNLDVDVDVVHQFHKYGFEWAEDRMIFYFDDVPYHVCYNVPGIPQGKMAMWLALAIYTPANNVFYPYGLIEPTAPMPKNYDPNNTMRFEIDYFRYYRRKISNCHTDYTILTNSDLATYPTEIRHDIYVGVTGTEVITMNPSSTQLIRFSGDFNIICDFEVPLGDEITAIYTPCN